MNTNRTSKKSNDESSARLRRRDIPSAVAMIVFGAVVSLLTWLVFFPTEISRDSKFFAFCSALGFAFLGFGALYLIRTLWFLRHEDARRTRHVQETDERQNYIVMRSVKTTAGICLCLSVVAMFAFAILNPTVFHTLLITYAVVLVIYGIVRTVYEHRL